MLLADSAAVRGTIERVAARWATTLRQFIMTGFSGLVVEGGGEVSGDACGVPERGDFA